MPKKVKTKKQKIKADLKKVLSPSISNNLDTTAYSIAKNTPSANSKVTSVNISQSPLILKNNITALEYPHLTSDLKKTITLTIAIALIQIIIKITI